ncbi:MAG: hypothetical protein Q9213_000693 [Squamulea squamosa]
MNTYAAPPSITSIQTLYPNRHALPSKPYSDSSRLAPEDAFLAHSPPHIHAEAQSEPRLAYENTSASFSNVNGRRKREKERGRSGSRRGKGEWKKLLWVKQPKCTILLICFAIPASDATHTDPDNYTDPPTFLSHLQRNPRLQPYDFWPLVADSTVIVQHLASVAIFVCCFVGINRGQVSPVSVVSLGSAGTIFGWVFWDFWVGRSEAAKRTLRSLVVGSSSRNDAYDHGSDHTTDSNQSPPPSQREEPSGLGLTLATGNPMGNADNYCQASSVVASSTSLVASATFLGTDVQPAASYTTSPGYDPPMSILSMRNQQRLATVKSAILIYCVLHGLSPILKSLTMSTSKDSIWALSSLLMCINILFFDYGGGVGVK